jgi:hypothetical protein
LLFRQTLRHLSTGILLFTDDGPAPPAWVNADGTVDFSRMPKELPVAGPDGEPLEDELGRELCANIQPDLTSPPTEARGAEIPPPGTRELSREVKDGVETVTVEVTGKPTTHLCAE